jgi:hypothetical protein
MRWTLIGALACFVACASPLPDKDDVQIPVKLSALRNVAHVDELRGAVAMAIEALDDCASIECLVGAGFPLVTPDDLARPRPGPLRDIMATVESPSLVALEFIPRDARDRGDSWTVMASHNGRRWRFSWPERLGPPMY